MTLSPTKRVAPMSATESSPLASAFSQSKLPAPLAASERVETAEKTERRFCDRSRPEQVASEHITAEDIKCSSLKKRRGEDAKEKEEVSSRAPLKAR